MPVGTIALGRIFNVVGSVIDRYSEVPQSYKFSSSYQHTLHDYICYLFIKQTFQNITFYSLDTYFALSKPIHRNPPHITSLSISVTLFETGIKVINLLTPYKKGGKIGNSSYHGVN